MSLAHAILGFLNKQPMTGYDLKTECFDHSVAHFWPADQAQIYRTLEKLTTQGFVENHIEYQQDRPNRKLYAITEAGRTELHHWLASPQALPAFREPFLVQLFFGDELEPQVMLALLNDQIAAHRALLAVYHKIKVPAPNTSESTRDLTFQGLTLELGIRNELMVLEWLDLCVNFVQKGAIGSSSLRLYDAP